MAVYSWGFGKNGQLGNGLRENQTLPTVVKFVKKSGLRKSDRVVEISAGGLFTSVLTESGKIFSFGCGKHGRLGLGDDNDRCEAAQVDYLSSIKVIKISCGLWHACAVDESGAVISWGYNKTHNVLGHSEEENINPSLPNRIGALSGVKVVGVSCGNNFTLAWDEDGIAYSWGYGKHGVLGQGDEEDVKTPKVIQQLVGHHIVYMNAGYSHCGAVTSDGKLFVFGQGKYAALGLGPKHLSDKYVPVQVAIEGVKFKEISCSVSEHHGHSLGLSQEGLVYSWGDGYKGKLGLGDQEFRYTPTLVPVENFCSVTIRHVSAGGIHSSAVSDEGRVFTWGCGSDGRLGHPEAAGHRYLFRSDVPRVVDTLSSKGKVINVCASYYHTVALIEKY